MENLVRFRLAEAFVYKKSLKEEAENRKIGTRCPPLQRVSMPADRRVVRLATGAHDRVVA